MTRPEAFARARKLLGDAPGVMVGEQRSDRGGSIYTVGIKDRGEWQIRFTGDSWETAIKAMLEFCRAVLRNDGIP